MTDASNTAAPARNPRRESDRKTQIRERMAQTGGARLKLAVFGEIPGFKLYWENDEDNAMEQRLYEGFEYVEPSEVRMEAAIVADKDVTNRVSKYVGKKADGSPLRAYLMKLDEDLWNERQALSQEQANTWDSAIRAGTVGSVDNRYKPKGAETEIKTGMR